MKDLSMEHNLEKSAIAHYKILRQLKERNYEALVVTYVEHVLTLKKKNSSSIYLMQKQYKRH